MIEITWTDEKRIAVCDKISEWLIEHEADSGEMMQQNDSCQEDAINLLCDLVDDIIKPERPEDNE